MAIYQDKSKQFAVLGLGLSGMACLRFLLKQGIRPVLFDTRTSLPNQQQIELLDDNLQLELGPLQADKLKAFDILVVSPGLDCRQTAIQAAKSAGVQLINEIELFAQAITQFDCQLVGITGSNGKSTVTSLLGEALNQLQQNAIIGGNIGTPALDCLVDIDLQQHSIFVIELSSFQLELCPSLACDVAMMLNLSEDHMDRYNSLADYGKTKRNIFNHAGLALYWADDPACQPTNPEQPQQSFALENRSADWSVCLNGMVTTNLEEKGDYQIQLDASQMVGAHNLLNQLAVVAAIAGLGIHGSETQLIDALAGYQGLDHRCQLVSRKFAVNWIDDSKATNVGATLAALQGLAGQPGKLILIAGGDGKSADFSELKTAFDNQVSHLLTIGKDGPLLAKLFESNESFSTLEQAVNRAAELAEQGDTVLLSPACASLDMFSNFVERGIKFKQAVEAL